FYDPFLLPDPITDPANPAVGQYNPYIPAPEGEPPTIPHVPLRGQNPTLPSGSIFGSNPSFFSGAWEAPNPVGAQGGGTVHPQSISYLGTPSLGGSARNQPIPEVIDDEFTGNFTTFDGRTARALSSPWDSTTDTSGFASGAYYLSFLA